MKKDSAKTLFLRSLFVSKLTHDVQQFLFEHAEFVNLASEQYLHRKGDPFSGIFCLLSGKLKATGVTREGVEYSLAHVMPGAVIGEIAYLDNGPRTHDAKAIVPSYLARLPKPLLDQACALFPVLHTHIVQLACLHIRQSFSVVDDFLTLSPEQRLAKRLMAMANEYAGAPSVRINQQELAAWIGISRQSINKILSKWQKQGIIDVAYRQLSLNNITALKAIYSS